MPDTMLYDPDALLGESETAKMLSVSTRTLQAWRLKGGGPMFVRCGRAVRYRRRDLISWIDANAVSSTSQEPGQGPAS